MSDSGRAAWCDWPVRSCARSSSGEVRFFDGQFSSAGRGKSKPSAGVLASGDSCGSRVISMEASTHAYRPTNPVALGAGATLIVNVKTVRPCLVVCHAGINDEGFLLQL